MLERGEFRSVELYRSTGRGVWMWGIRDTRAVWDGYLPDVPLDSSEEEAKLAAERVVRQDWGLTSSLAWTLGRRGEWIGVPAS